MSHPDDGQLHALVDGELSPAEAAGLEAHFHACDECRRRFDEARSLLGESDRIVATLDVPPRAAAPKPPVRTGPDYRLLGLAASALLVVTAGWLVLRPAFRAKPPAEQETMATPAPTAPTASNEAARRAAPSTDRARQEEKTEMAKESGKEIAEAVGAAQPQAVRADTPPTRPADGVALNDLPPWKAKVAAPTPPPASARFRLDGLDVVSSAPLPGGGIRLVYSVNGRPVEFDQVPATVAAPAPAHGEVHELTWPRDDLRLTLRSTLAVGELERLRQMVR